MRSIRPYEQVCGWQVLKLTRARSMVTVACERPSRHRQAARDSDTTATPATHTTSRLFPDLRPYLPPQADVSADGATSFAIASTSPPDEPRQYNFYRLGSCSSSSAVLVLRRHSNRAASVTPILPTRTSTYRAPLYCVAVHPDPDEAKRARQQLSAPHPSKARSSPTSLSTNVLRDPPPINTQQQVLRRHNTYIAGHRSYPVHCLFSPTTSSSRSAPFRMQNASSTTAGALNLNPNSTSGQVLDASAALRHPRARPRAALANIHSTATSELCRSHTSSYQSSSTISASAGAGPRAGQCARTFHPTSSAFACLESTRFTMFPSPSGGYYSEKQEVFGPVLLVDVPVEWCWSSSSSRAAAQRRVDLLHWLRLAFGKRDLRAGSVCNFLANEIQVLVERRRR